MSKNQAFSLGSQPAILAAWDAPQLWLNPEYQVVPSVTGISIEDMKKAAERLARFAPLLMQLFPETQETAGIIESPLVPLAEHFYENADGCVGRAWVKCDHALAVAGSIKARGGIHEVLEFTESLALRHGLIPESAGYEVLSHPQARSVFGQYEVSVGSTGNLGMSIGLMAAALGFRATVHMSSDAKAWKKTKLRQQGVHVVEHAGDYAQAVAAGRKKAEADPQAYFVDDEHSTSLFFGYSVAALRLATQAQGIGLRVDGEHPLFVYLPCGVGGAPAGIAFGLKALFGEHVHCFFVEPMASPCFMVRMRHPDRPGITVYDVGLDNRTEADGLAVPAASELAIEYMRPLLSGLLTTADDTLFADLFRLHALQGLKVEPSAAAGCSGPRMLFASPQGQSYLRSHGLDRHMTRANHIIWSTGGLFVPDAEFDEFLARGRQQVAGCI